MSLIFTDDDIDFGLYMDMTDSDHKVRPASDYADEVSDYFWSDKTPKGAKPPFAKAANCIRFRPHEVSLWAGYNGHRKSLLLGQMVLGFATQGERACIASFEMRPVITLSRMARQASAVAKPSHEFLFDFHKAIGQQICLYDQQGMVNAEKIIGVIRYAAEKRRCQHFVLDSLMKCGLGEENNANAQTRFVDQLCTVARETGIHIHLVAHCRKGKDELSPPSKTDVRGSSSIIDQVDNIIMVWSNKAKEADLDAGKTPKDNADAYMLVQKQRNGEWEGALKFWVDKASQQFLESDQQAHCLIDLATQTEVAL